MANIDVHTTIRSTIFRRTDPHWSNLAEMLLARASEHPHRPAVTFLGDDGMELETLSYCELYQRATAVAQLLKHSTTIESRAVLLFPPGIEFVVGFFGCILAGVVPAPSCFPKRGRVMPRLEAIIRDCAPSFLLADQVTLNDLAAVSTNSVVNSLPWVSTNGPAANSLAHAEATTSLPGFGLGREALALLQYTSGSTSQPRGVMVSHGNLMANLEAIRQGFGLSWQPKSGPHNDTGVFWLPAFHDMGLIGGILEPLYIGAHTILLSPRAFLARPLRWLESISRFKATTSGAPNFAFQLCVDRAKEIPAGLDLSHWRTAFCGAEPIRAETLEEFARVFAPYGFDAGAFYPCYGLAESTLLAAGGKGPVTPNIVTLDRAELAAGKLTPATAQGGIVSRLVSCGQPVRQTEMQIVDPETLKVRRDGEIGEIWLRGPSVAKGYFNRPEVNEKLFSAITFDGEGPFLRTGDLGGMLNGELLVTGRIKDVIILRGRNLYPQDIEATVVEAIGEGAGKCAAFSVSGPFGDELCVALEIPRPRDEDELHTLARKVRSVVVEHHETDIRHLRLVRLASVPLTSSGKVQRSACREAMENGTLKVRYAWDRSALKVDGIVVPRPALSENCDAAEIQRVAETIQRWLLQWLIDRAGVSQEEAIASRPFAEFGLDSLASVELSSELQDWLGVDLSPVVAWNYPTAERLSSYLANLMAGIDEIADANTDPEFERLLQEVEHLSPEEIERALAAKEGQ